MASAIAFGGTFDRRGLGMLTARVCMRIWQIGWAQVCLFVTLLALAVRAGPQYVDLLNLGPALRDPGLIEKAKAGELVYGSAGNASASHVATLLLGQPVPPELLPHRLPAVLAVVYLIFNEGYTGEVDLAAEAIRLTRQLAAAIDHPEVRGLLALNLAIAAASSMVIVNTVVLVQARYGLDQTATAVALVADSTISISRPASDRFSSDSLRTPLSSPVTTEMVASRVVATIRPICTGMVTGRP